ncbi:malate/L-lactate dehydrogenase [Salinisphaera hydrothermalis C41B8]|uniref:Malate/L-lactate dehydrogenase n=2 Tax=Salinisphaera TaxID=180541 RepID=A0A084IL11_SALHC|nr:malate/L-lactate dehydrogenase [Salinisphaera hydrothermalis C41B8]
MFGVVFDHRTTPMRDETGLTSDVVDADALRRWAAEVLQRQNLGVEDATLVANCLVQTSLWGIDTHGIARLPHYLNRLDRGSIEAKPALKIERTGPATASVDGGHGLGMVVCDAAMNQAIQCAEEAGAGVVGCYHSSHCGAIGLYGRQAAARGMIGIAFTHSDAFVAPHAGRHAFLGTNPICIAVPSAEGEPVCLDTATSIIPFNRVMNARRDGVSLPPGTAIDAEGEPTTDAEAARSLLPFAEHKGYALGFMIDVLCGLLNGMTFGPHIAAMYGDLEARRNLGSLMMAIDPGRFFGGDALAVEVARMAAEARAMPAREGAEVLAPGDPEYRCERQRRRDGIPIEPGLAAEIRDWSQRLHIEAPPLRAAS